MRSIYTPQMVIGGVDQVVGARPMEVADSLAALKARGPAAELDVRRDGDEVIIAARLVRDADGAILVQLVRYQPHGEVDILRGENAGRKIAYTNVVTDWEILTEWDGESALSLRAPAPGDESAAVILQEHGQGQILAAAIAD